MVHPSRKARAAFQTQVARLLGIGPDAVLGPCALLVLAALAWLPPAAAEATPARIIILRHGEKADDWRLCKAGEARAQALAGRYLGRGAAVSLFPPGTRPAAFYAITLHTLELVSPAAASWAMPVTFFSVLPEAKKDFVVALNERTQEAVGSVLEDPRWTGQTVVMVWEHDHIADAALEAKFTGQAITLHQLLGLDGLADVPATWPGETYDYFWLVDFDAATGKPNRFQMQQQLFPGDAAVPSNAWGAGQALPAGCVG